MLLAYFTSKLEIVPKLISKTKDLDYHYYLLFIYLFCLVTIYDLMPVW